MRRRPLGVTLVELVITIALVAILLGLGVPAMRELIQNNCQATQINDLLLSLNLARTAAVKHGSPAFLCISDRSATPNCDDNSVQWENGWIAFVDGNQSGASRGKLDSPFDADADGFWDAGEDWLIQTHPALDCGATLRGSGNIRSDIGYDPRGFSAPGTLRLCDDRGAQEARGIVIGSTGRPRLATDADDDGSVEDDSGEEFTCP